MWKVMYGLLFVGLVFLFGDLFWSMFETFQKTKSKRLCYFISTGFLLLLFIILRLLNNTADTFMSSG